MKTNLGMRKSGFTLIELLIVIAIILILISIALPNFLEAQSRAKVARSMADMKAFETAYESYFIDWKHYPWPMCCKAPQTRPGREGWPNAARCWQTNNLLEVTTPAKYMSTVNLRDVFYNDLGETMGLWSHGGFYTYQPYHKDGWFMKGRDAATQRLAREAWCQLGWGPSQHHPTTPTGQVIPVHFPDWGPGTRGGLGWGDAVYSPTNGSRSGGILYRCGGSLRGWFNGNGIYAMSPRIG